ncbi:MAG: DUF4976 domain-containing protein, partial [Verrucomicrobia bacterium]|nr:DUF4976 domain-containing protein [Verrucomicrobiota bacterium]
IAGLEIPKKMQGRSLWPVLSDSEAKETQRCYARCEYYGALQAGGEGLDSHSGSYATMIRDKRYKLAWYHGQDTGELFDMETDPGEFDNLWDHPDFKDIRFELMKANFDQLAFAVDVGPEATSVY